MTRKDYMDGKVTHREYYASVARAAGIQFPANHSLVIRASRSKDEHYNDIPLATWDGYSLSARGTLAKAFQAHEDGFSLAGGVCVMKEAVRQAVEREGSTCSA